MISKSTSGEFRKSSLDLPFIVQIGDTAIVTGNVVSFIRAGIVVATRIISAESEPVPIASQSVESINHVMFFRSKPVPGIQATIINAVRNPTTGSIRFDFASGNQREFTGGLEEAINAVSYLDTDVATAEDMLILKTLRRSPDGANLENCIGAQCSCDFNANDEMILTIGAQ